MTACFNNVEFNSSSTFTIKLTACRTREIDSRSYLNNLKFLINP